MVADDSKKNIKTPSLDLLAVQTTPCMHVEQMCMLRLSVGSSPQVGYLSCDDACLGCSRGCPPRCIWGPYQIALSECQE